MPLDLQKFKSAEIITDASKIAEMLDEAHKNAAKENKAAALQTVTRATDDGLMVCKQNVPTGSLAKAVTLTVEEIKAKAEKVGVKWQDGLDKRAKQWWASDERVDRHGDIVRQNWIFNDFQHNPLLLFGHEWENLPIGANIDWKVEGKNDGTYKGDALRLVSLYATKEEWAFADTIFRMVDGGWLRTGSVGFYPGKVVDIKDEKERADLGLGKWGYILDDNDLIEYSMCSVPANPGARVILNSMKSKNMLKAADIQVVRELERQAIIRSGQGKAAWKAADEQLLVHWKAFFPDVKVDKHENIDEPVLLDDIDVPEEKPTSEDEEITIESLKQDVVKLNEKIDEQGTMLEDIRSLLEGGQAKSKQKKEPEEQSQRSALEMLLGN